MRDTCWVCGHMQRNCAEEQGTHLSNVLSFVKLTLRLGTSEHSSLAPRRLYLLKIVYVNNFLSYLKFTAFGIGDLRMHEV